MKNNILLWVLGGLSVVSLFSIFLVAVEGLTDYVGIGKWAGICMFIVVILAMLDDIINKER